MTHASLTAPAPTVQAAPLGQFGWIGRRQMGVAQHHAPSPSSVRVGAVLAEVKARILARRTQRFPIGEQIGKPIRIDALRFESVIQQVR